MVYIKEVPINSKVPKSSTFYRIQLKYYPTHPPLLSNIFPTFEKKLIMNIGDKIAEVLGIDQYGNEIKASDYRGRKIVLFSYPKASTPGCTAEACSLQQYKNELEEKGYAIIGVSKDKQSAQQKFAEKYGLEFPLIADTETTLLQTLGCWGEKVFCGKKTIGTLRTTYLVNEEGIIEQIMSPKEIKTKIHAEQILERI